MLCRKRLIQGFAKQVPALTSLRCSHDQKTVRVRFAPSPTGKINIYQRLENF